MQTQQLRADTTHTEELQQARLFCYQKDSILLTISFSGKV